MTEDGRHDALGSNHRRCSVRKAVLRCSHNAQHNNCARVPFLIKLQACSFIKKETLSQVFSCEFCGISKKTFFTEHLWTTASIEMMYQEKCFGCVVKWISQICTFLTHQLQLLQVKNLEISIRNKQKKDKKCFSQSVIDTENDSFTGVLKECTKFYSLLANLISNLQKYLQKEPTKKDCPGIITCKTIIHTIASWKVLGLWFSFNKLL